MSSLNSQSKSDFIRVLHVDDDKAILEISKQILQSLDDRLYIDFASCIDEAHKKLNSAIYDVVVSDYELPTKNGLEFLSELKEKGIDIPFILFTGKGREEIAIEALNLGADGYYNKQGNPETVYGELLHGIKNAVAKKQTENKLLESERLTQHIIDSTPNLIYIYDIVENRNVYSNKEIIDFLGYTTEQIQAMGSNLFANLLHPDDVKAVAGHHAKFVDAPDNAVYELDYRMKHANGQWRWLRSYDILFARTPEGKGKQILGSCEDITERKNAKKKLMDSEAKFKSLFNNAEIGMFRTRLDGLEILDCNDKFLSIFGLTREEVIGKPSVTHWADPLERQQMAQQLREQGKITDFDCKMLNKQGETRFCRTSLRLYPELKILEGSITDITEQKKTQEALSRNEKHYRELYERLPFGYQSLNAEGYFLEVNQTWLEMLGYAREEVVGRWFGDFLFGNQVEAFRQRFPQFKSAGRIHSEFEIKRKDGSIASVAFEGMIEYDEHNNFKKTHCLMQDITESKKAKLEREQKYEALERVAESLDSGLAIVGKDYRIIWANNILKEAGFKPNQKCYAAIHRNDICPDCGVRKVFEENRPLDVHEFKTVNSKGETTFIELRATPLRDKYGNITSAIELAVPITERKKAEKTLLENEEKFRNLAEESPNMIFINFKGKVVYANKKCEKILGYRREEFYADDFDFLRLIAPECVKPLMDSFKVHQSGKEVAPFEYSLVTKKGKKIKAIINSKLIEYQDGQAILGIVTDITERKRADEKESTFLECAHAVLKGEKFEVIARKIFDSAKRLMDTPVGVVVLLPKDGAENKVLFFGETGSNYTVRSNLSVQGLLDTAYRIQKVTYTNDFPNSSWVKFMPNDHVYLENVLFAPLTVDGNTVGLLGFANKPGGFTEYDKELADGFGVYAAIALSSSWKLSAIANQHAQLESINEKLCVLGSLTRHDVGNKLMAARANMYLLRKRLKDNPELLKYVDAVDQAFNQSIELFRFSKVYEKIGSEKLEDVNVAHSFDWAVELLPHVGVEVVNSTQGLTVVADSLLGQLFYNLVDNSLKHGKTVSKVQLSYTKTAKEVKLVYEDNGIGIPRKNKQKIFAEGFSTGGSGFGLKLVKKMIEVYGWTITEEGNPGEGVKFVITIPLYNKKTKPSPFAKATLPAFLAPKITCASGVTV